MAPKKVSPAHHFPSFLSRRASAEDGRQTADSSPFPQHAIAWWRRFSSEAWGQESHELKANGNVYGKQNEASNNKVCIFFFHNDSVILGFLTKRKTCTCRFELKLSWYDLEDNSGVALHLCKKLIKSHVVSHYWKVNYILHQRIVVCSWLIRGHVHEHRSRHCSSLLFANAAASQKDCYL